MTNYQLADLAVRFTVAGRTYNQKVYIFRTNFALKIVSLFLKQGLIQNFSIKFNIIEVNLKFFRKKPLIKALQVISTPGRRTY